MSIFRVGRHGRCCSSAFRALSRQYASAEAVTLSSPYSSSAADTGRDVPKKRTRIRKKAAPAKPKDTSPTVLEVSEVHSFLANIAATKETITLEDVERHKPARHSDPARAYDKYLEEYNALQEVLANSFNIKQLRQLLRLYGFKGVYPTKPAYAAQIMEKAWDYPALADIVRQRKDATEQVSQSEAFYCCTVVFRLTLSDVRLPAHPTTVIPLAGQRCAGKAIQFIVGPTSA